MCDGFYDVDMRITYITYAYYKAWLLFLDCLNLKMTALHSFNALVTIYQLAQHNKPEDLQFHQVCYEKTNLASIYAVHYWYDSKHN